MEIGTITIKSAWVEMDGFEAKNFHTRISWVQDPLKGTCRKVEMGLVGLHIAHKTERSPQWVWASFEHVDNAPYRGKPFARARYTFNNGKPGEAMPDHPPGNARIPKDPRKEFTIPPPYNVERLKDIAPELQKVNEQWRKLLGEAGSVWANYELVAVQWAGQGANEGLMGAGRDEAGYIGAFPTPPCGIGSEPNVSNSVIETFLQPHTVCRWDLTCMSCHNRARSYDFVWSIPLAHGKTATLKDSVARRASLSILYEIVGPTLSPQ